MGDFCPSRCTCYVLESTTLSLHPSTSTIQVLLYGKASQQRIGPYILISKRRLLDKAQPVSSSQSSFKPNKEPMKTKKYPQGRKPLRVFLVTSLLNKNQSLSPVILRYQPRWCCLAQARVTVP